MTRPKAAGVEGRWALLVLVAATACGGSPHAVSDGASLAIGSPQGSFDPADAAPSIHRADGGVATHDDVPLAERDGTRGVAAGDARGPSVLPDALPARACSTGVRCAARPLQAPVADAAPASVSGEGGFGFDYWPLGKGPEALYAQHWPAVRAEVAADLDVIKSLRSRVVRLVFWAKPGGFENPGDPDPARRFGHLDEIVATLPALLRSIADRDMKIIIAFANTYLTDCEAGAGRSCHLGASDVHQQPWWVRAYGRDDPNNFKAFVDDSLHWVKAIVAAAESSSAAQSILYYDVQVESTDDVELAWNYAEVLLEWAAIPHGKLGLSILHVRSLDGFGDDVPSLQRLAAYDQLRYVSFHPYPKAWFGPGFPAANVQAAYAELRDRLPDKIVHCAEFGAWNGETGGTAETCRDETACQMVQSRLVGETFDALVASRAPYYLHWMLWDHTPNAIHQEFGLARSHHELKQAYGAVLERTSAVPNPSFEARLDGANTPAHWRHGTWSRDGALASQLAWMGPHDAALGQAYARVRVDQLGASAGVWLASDLVPVVGGRPIYFNGYIRSAGLENIRMEVHEYDAAKQEIGFHAGPAFEQDAWAWRSYRHMLTGVQQPVRAALRADARYAIIAVAADVAAAPAYLDVDAFSAAQ